jgi:hypothetical protein
MVTEQTPSDEADVFLESRGRGVASNAERNALVSVFLRVLEYYQACLPVLVLWWTRANAELRASSS